MCFDPVSLAITAAATAATAGGNRLNQIASEKAVKHSVAGELERQKIYQSRADQNFGDALNKFNPQSTQQAITDTTNARNDTIAGNLAGPNTAIYDTVQQNQPEVVKSTLAKSLSDAVSKSKGEAQRLAALGATGDVMANNNRSLDTAGSNAGVISNFAQGSENVNAMERAAAAKKRSGLGDALGLVGQGLSFYNAVSAPGRTNGSMFGGGEVKPTGGAYGPGQYSSTAAWQNLF